MYTPATLLDIATKAEARYTELLVQFPPGTINYERNQARRDMDAALACASWMEVNGHTQLTNVGPFIQTKVCRGMTVRIRKGARIFGTHPSVPKHGIESRRAQLVMTHNVDQGYVDLFERSEGPKVIQGRVHWAGTGGYWRWTDINNVELVPTTEQFSN